MKTKTRRKSVLAIIVAIILVLLVISTVVTNVIFSGEKMPKIAGNYLYHRMSVSICNRNKLGNLWYPDPYSSRCIQPDGLYIDDHLYLCMYGRCSLR